MNCRYFSRAVALAGFCSTALLTASEAQAGNFSAEYVFGDSLSDNGNLAAAFGTDFPNPPSFNNSFTNGKVAVQLLAESLGLSANASLWLTAPNVPAGTNYAVGGATAALGTDLAPGVNINLPTQVGAYSLYASGQADPNALYVLMIGGNDVRNAALDGTGAPAVTEGVETELAAISTLSGEGAKHFLVVNVPNVGIIPEFAQENPTLAAGATAFSQLYDQELAAGLAALDPSLGAGATLTDFDLYDYNAGLLAKAGELGFTNTTDPCYSNTPVSAASNTGCSAANIDSFIYWDDIHPTAGVHALWAEGFEAAVPEPSTWAMLLIGFGALGFAGYRARARAAG
jgi:outer membrane lipase/esterase